MEEKQLQLHGLHRGHGNIQSRYSLLTDDRPGGSGRIFLCAAFDGEYRQGRAGSKDACYMSGCLRTALNKWPCRGLILDLTGLRYGNGRDMDTLLTMNRRPPWLYSRLEIMAITSPLNEAGLRALCRSLRLEKAGPLLADDKAGAVATLDRKIKAQPSLSARDRRH